MQRRDGIILQILEGDPFAGCCGVKRTSEEDLEKLQDMLRRRQETLDIVKRRFGSRIHIERDIISRMRPAETYPPHIRTLIKKNLKPPLVLLNKDLIWHGSFPDPHSFVGMIEAALWQDAPADLTKAGREMAERN